MTCEHLIFEVIHKSWSKRRKPTREPDIDHVRVPDFEFKKNHFCDMHITYTDGHTRTLLGRVLQNHISGQWTVDGMHVAVRVIDPNTDTDSPA